MSAVVTRIAPSPTGSMHIGNARAALFNWLYARHCGGVFLLRIEDTDRQRSTEESVKVIFESLEWLELTPDAPAVFQFARADLHRQMVDQLIERGWAYRCYMTVEESDAAKAAARIAGHALRSPWRDRAAEAGSSAPFVVRFKTPMDGDTVIEDAVRGTVHMPNKDLEDLILLRTDGTPTYNVAVTVDDHDMGVTHVIRGEEHLGNAARQALMYRAMDWTVPVFAHLPLILGADGSKMSKRHGAQSVGEFREMGYLPEALRNYLTKLGWGHGDDEIFSDAQAIAWFDIKDVVKAGARFDVDKLNAINAHYLRQSDDGRLGDLAVELMTRQGEAPDPDVEASLRRTIPLIKDGAKTILDLLALSAFTMRQRPLKLDDKTVGLLTEETRDRLARLRDRLAAHAAWIPADIEAMLRAFAEEEGVGLGKIGPMLRGVLSGGSPAPDLGRTLSALQRDEVLARIDDALSPAL